MGLKQLSTLGFYTPEAYGAVGDGSTNDAAAFTAMIAAMPSGTGSTVYLGPKDYRINSTVTINKQVNIIGHGKADFYLQGAGSTISTSSATATVFDVQANQCSFEKFFIKNVATTPTAGCAFKFTQNTVDGHTFNAVKGFLIRDVTIDHFYDNIVATNAFQWNIVNSEIMHPMRDGIQIGCSSLPDAGDWSIYGNCQFIARDNSRYAIYQTSGGGGKLVGNKFNANFYGLTGTFDYHYYGTVSGTSIALIHSNSFEWFDTCAVYIRDVDTAFNSVSINNNQSNPYTTSGLTHYDIGDVTNVSVTGNLIYGNGGIGVKLTNCVDVVVGNAYTNVTTKLSQTGSSNVTNLTP